MSRHTSGAICDCGYSLKKGEEVVSDPADDPNVPEPGDVVRCPDGLKGIVAAVDGYAVWVEGWHEQFKASELDVIHPDDGMNCLLEARGFDWPDKPEDFMAVVEGAGLVVIPTDSPDRAGEGE